MRRVIIGVCLVRNYWKLLRDDECAKTFIERDEAVAAAKHAARLSVASGHDVRLYFQDVDGRYQEQAIASCGH